MEHRKAPAIKIYGDLDSVQRGVANTISDVLNWDDIQNRQLTVKDGKLQFANSKQRFELQELLAKLNAAEVQQQNVLKAAVTLQEKEQIVMKEANDQMRRLLNE